MSTADTPDNRGRTLIWWAVGNGHEAVAKQLLEGEGVNPARLERYN